MHEPIRYHADSFNSKYYAPALKIEMPELNPESMPNAEPIEHTFCPKTCLSLELLHLYTISFIWRLA